MRKLLLEMVMVVVGLGIAAGLLAGLDKRVEVESLEVEADSLKGLPQKTEQTDLRPLESRRLFELAEPGEPLWGPLAVRMDPQGRPMVIDYGDMSIKLMSAEGSLLATLGNGEGQGPGEFVSITDVAFLEDKVWVADSSNSRLTAFNREGELLETLKLATPPYRVAAMTEDWLLVMHSLTDLEAFGVYSFDGTQRNVFGKFVDEPWDGLAIEGEIARSPAGSFFFVGRYGGFFAHYSQPGELRYIRETLRPTPLPDLTRRNGMVRVSLRSEISALSASVNEQKLFLLRGTRVGEWLSDRVDVYALDSGDYLHSFLLPEASKAAYFYDSFMYLTDGSSLSKWTYEVQ